MPVERQRDQLDFRVGAAHAVAVNDGQTQFAADGKGQHRVHAADLRRHHGADRLAQVAAHRVVGGHQLFRHGDPLQERHRRTNGEGERDQHVVWQFIDIRQLQWPEALHGLDRRQLAEIGIAATASAEHRRAAGDILNFLTFQQSHA